MKSKEKKHNRTARSKINNSFRWNAREIFFLLHFNQLIDETDTR